MTTVQVPDPGRAGQTTQACPSCDGLMPAEAVIVGHWKTSRKPASRYERTVWMHCPHCGYHQKRVEIVPEDAFLAHSRLIGDR